MGAKNQVQAAVIHPFHRKLVTCVCCIKLVWVGMQLRFASSPPCTLEWGKAYMQLVITNQQDAH